MWVTVVETALMFTSRCLFIRTPLLPTLKHLMSHQWIIKPFNELTTFLLIPDPALVSPCLCILIIFFAPVCIFFPAPVNCNRSRLVCWFVDFYFTFFFVKQAGFHLVFTSSSLILWGGGKTKMWFVPDNIRCMGVFKLLKVLWSRLR